MVEGVALALAAVVAVGAAALLTKRTSLPAPVVLVVVGLVYAELPGPNVELDPDVILLLVLPPLLYSAALSASLIEIRSHLRVVVLLSVGLVVVTALTVAGLLTLVVAGLPFAAACAFGAAVAPNDPVAALAIGRRVGLPRRLVSIVEGESLINDATALTAYQVRSSPSPAASRWVTSPLASRQPSSGGSRWGLASGGCCPACAGSSTSRWSRTCSRSPRRSSPSCRRRRSGRAACWPSWSAVCGWGTRHRC